MIPGFDSALGSFPRSNDPVAFAGTWREAAVRARLLPIYSDWTTCFALTEDGDIVHSEGTWEAPSKLANPRHRHVVLAQASLRYPELDTIRPVRQPDDPTCPSCRGTGHMRVGDKVYEEFICECGGLGWFPRGTTLQLE